MKLTDDSRLDPDFSRVHLQWFADTDESGAEEEIQDGETNVENEVAELKKAFNQLKKESSGKDRKVSELLEENKKLKEKKGKQAERERRKLELDDMSQEELKREIERREDEIKSEYEKELNEIREQNKQNEFVQSIYRIAPEIENLPPHVIKLLTLPKDIDNERLKEAMESARDEVNALVSKNRFVLDNKSKIGPQLKSGKFDGEKIPSAREWAKLSDLDKKNWTKYATNEQLKKLQDMGFD